VRYFYRICFAFSISIYPIATQSKPDADLATCQGPDLKKRIPACTRLLDRKGLPPEAISGIYHIRGNAYFSTGDTDRAISDEINSIKFNPKNSESYNGLAGAYRTIGQIDRALSYLDQALRLKPDSVPYLSNRAQMYLLKEDYQSAIADFDRALRIDPKNAITLLGRGGAQLKVNKLDEAISDLNKSIAIDPKNIGAIEGLGDIWRAKSDVDRAIAEYSRGLDIDPQWASLYTARGKAYESKGDFSRAIADYEKAVSLPTTKLVAVGGNRMTLGTQTENFSSDQAAANARLIVLKNQSGSTAPSGVSNPPSQTNAKEEGRRVALVIGNGAYTNANRLTNPANDAKAIASNLRDMGFDVAECIDLDRENLQNQISKFLLQSIDAHIALVFYAGHGIQADGKNYLVPVDTKFDNSRDWSSSLTSVDTILAALQDKIRTNILILDACRDNPLSQPNPAEQGSQVVAARSTSGPGLAAQSGIGAGAIAGAGTLIVFSTAPGQVALDGDGSNSPFSTALIRHISTKKLEIQQMMTRVRADVVASTNSKQVPWSNSSLIGEVYLDK